jgi:hypothetical protein
VAAGRQLGSCGQLKQSLSLFACPFSWLAAALAACDLLRAGHLIAGFTVLTARLLHGCAFACLPAFTLAAL